MWAKGAIGAFKYQVKFYEEGSSYGIQDGKISKLLITLKGVTVAEYDRAWGVEPAGTAVVKAYKALLKKYN